MSYEKYKDEFDELLKEPWVIKNEKKILAIMKDDATPKEVYKRIMARYRELIEELGEALRSQRGR